MNCIFGLFDVLGFQSFCEFCDSNDAEKVLKVMDDFETEIPDVLLRQLDEKIEVPESSMDTLKSRLKWLTFSDTIFVAMPFDQSSPSSFDLIFFSVMSAYINRRMFEIGLPVRGAIHIGDVMISRRCFAGKAIMEAHRLSQKCQLAVTVISDEAHTLIIKAFSEFKVIPAMYAKNFVEYFTPTMTIRDSTPVFLIEPMKTLCWFFLEMGRMERFVIPDDVDSYVQEKFTAHGKQILGKREQLKTANTIEILNAWKILQSGRQQIILRRNPAKQP